jgi:hypothetical protein
MGADQKGYPYSGRGWRLKVVYAILGAFIYLFSQPQPPAVVEAWMPAKAGCAGF